MRLLVLFSVLFMGFSLQVNAGCIRGNCKDGKGILITAEGDRFEGVFSSWKLNGEGHWRSRHGDTYKGSFVNGKITGRGKFTLSNGEYYIGELKNGRFEGKGKFTYKSGDSYLGYWKDGMHHGEGTYTYRNGTVMSGLFQYGSLVDNTPQDGYFREENTYVVKQKERPIRTFNEASTEGNRFGHINKDCTNDYCHDELGIFYYSDGSKYMGEFYNGEPEGQGRCEYINGDVYEGGWASHSPHGKGLMTFSQGRKFAARWKKGKPQEELLNDLDYVPKIKSKTTSFSESVDVYALVVGVASYDHMPSLKYTDDDAYQLFAFLRSPEGGAIPNNNIKVLVDDIATKNNILLAMEQLFSRADENDVIMLYMSGHGLEGSFIPSDFDGYNNQIKYREITEILDKSRAKHKLAIADACHSGSIMTSRGGDYAPAVDNYYKTMKTLESGGTALLLSSGANELSLEYSGLRQGVFSHYLLDGLSGAADVNHNKVVTLVELYDYIYSNVRKYTDNRQSPILTGNYNGGMPLAVIR